MLKSAEIRRQASQRLQEIFPRARGWEETPDARVGSQTADLLVKFRLGEHEQTLVVDVTSLGQPRQIRAAVTKLSEMRRALPTAYPVAAALLTVGADFGATIAMVVSWTLIGYGRAIAWELPIMGADFTLWRIVISLPIPVLAGALGRFVFVRMYPKGAPE